MRNAGDPLPGRPPDVRIEIPPHAHASPWPQRSDDVDGISQDVVATPETDVLNHTRQMEAANHARRSPGGHFRRGSLPFFLSAGGAKVRSSRSAS